MVKNDVRPERFLRPREFLRSTEAASIRIRKLLRRLRARHGPREASGPTDDALRLAGRIEDLSRSGLVASAADAIEIAEEVELLVAVLRSDVDVLLASRCQRVIRD